MKKIIVFFLMLILSSSIVFTNEKTNLKQNIHVSVDKVIQNDIVNIKITCISNFEVDAAAYTIKGYCINTITPWIKNKNGSYECSMSLKLNQNAKITYFELLSINDNKINKVLLK